MRSTASFALLLIIAISACQQGTTSSTTESTESVEQLETIETAEPIESTPSINSIRDLISAFKKNGPMEIPGEFSQKYFEGQNYTIIDIISAEGPLLSIAVSQTYSSASYQVYTFTSDGELLDSKVLLSSEGGDIYHYSFEVLSDRSFVLHRVLDLTLYDGTTDGPMTEEEEKNLTDLGNIESYYVIDHKGNIREFGVFNIGNWDSKNPLLNYSLIYSGLLSDLDLFCFSRRQGCSPITCSDQLDFILMKDDSVVDHFTSTSETESSPKVQVLHDTFVQFIETKHVWNETEDGVMDFDEKDNYTDGIRLALMDRQLIDLGKIEKRQVRLFRNLIFAKYGYKFKSDDLKAYFSKISWYQPKHENVDDMLSDEDKELATYLKGLEDQS
ncbi:MAG: YARHG domain-containing protein [Imperialibacter sp.]|uniref:YARHG domain-containing protein n=1 Tax=Imperialibacter sp. TaxID=2038411 RepID=UPI0032EAD6FE